ncbi:MAG: AI-2E family transporter [Armatimonadota bacterium]|nr:AI-2E family transporter [Armatimonadota bacterium]
MTKTRAETTLSVVWGFFVRLGLLAIIGYALYRVRSILVAVLLAVMLTYVALPAIEFLCSWKVKGWSYRSQRFWASVLVFVVILAVFGIMIQYIVAPIAIEARDLNRNVDDYINKLDTLLQKANKWYSALPRDVKDLFNDTDKEKIKTTVSAWFTRVVGSTIEWAQHALDIILIPVLAFYFALDYRSLRREFVGALPKARRREALHLLKHIGAILQNYIIGQLTLCVIAGVVVGLLLWGLDLNYALALAVLAGVTRAIPVVGPIISGIAIVLFGLIKAPQIGVTLLILFCLLHLVESKFLLPKLIGHQMRLHPAMIIIVLLIGGEFFGIFGMFLAAPVAAVLREMVRFYIIAPRAKREAEESGDNVDLGTPIIHSKLQ